MSGKETFLIKVKEIAGSEALDREPASLEQYSVSGAPPAAVVHASEARVLPEIMEAAARCGGKLVIAGSGTKLNTGLPPGDEYLALSTRKLNRISDHDVPNFTVTAQAGILLSSLNDALARENQYLPLDPPYKGATLGGTLCSNSNGPLRLLYGGLRDLILGAGIIAPDGRRGNFGGKVVKNVAGYDISRFLIGSSGTLCLLEEATMKLFPLPEREAGCAALFKAPGPALAASDRLRTSQLSPARIVLLNETVTLTETEDIIPHREGCCTLLTTFHGFEDSVRRQLKDTHQACVEQGAIDVENIEKDHMLWERIRAMDPSTSDEYAVILKIGIPSSRLAEAFAQPLWKPESSTRSCTLVDAGCGIIYLYLFYDGSGTHPEPGEAIRDITDRVKVYGGYLAIENAPYPLEKPPETDTNRRNAYGVMELIRQQFDPGRVLCPERFPWLLKV